MPLRYNSTPMSKKSYSALTASIKATALLLFVLAVLLSTVQGASPFGQGAVPPSQRAGQVARESKEPKELPVAFSVSSGYNESIGSIQCGELKALIKRYSRYRRLIKSNERAILVVFIQAVFFALV